jgi:very-short-patch-repair endonuclease
MTSTLDKAVLFQNAWNQFRNSAEFMSNYELHREYNFDSELNRKHRFDFAFPDALIAIEIEGNAWNVKGGGRHMRDGDLEKYNIAAQLGWRIFRFSPRMLIEDPFGCAEQVSKALEGDTKRERK